MKRTFCTLLCALLPLFAQAQIYSWTDEKGNKVFSDQPRDGAQQVEIREPNRISTPAPVATPASTPSRTRGGPPPGYQTLSITAPANDEAIRSNEGQLNISANIEPPLSRGHLLRLEMDGQRVGVPVPGNLQSTASFQLNNVDRGTHQLSVVVVNAMGEEVQRSSPVTVHLQRASLLQPNRAGQGTSPPPRPGGP